MVEVLSGQRFDEFLNERLFGPLGMNDTAFYVSEDKADRFAQVYTHDADGNLMAQEGFGGSRSYFDPPNFLSGGGLVSTTMDYMRFSQMLLKGGELDGVRILAPSTVKLMHLNHLPRELKEMSPGTGFGLDFAGVLDPVAADGISKGEYYWGGAAGTWFWIDPKEDLVFVGMIQHFGPRRPVAEPAPHLPGDPRVGIVGGTPHRRIQSALTPVDSESEGTRSSNCDAPQTSGPPCWQPWSRWESASPKTLASGK